MQLVALAFLASFAALLAFILLANRSLAALRALLGPDRMLPPSAMNGVITLLVYLPASASFTTVFLGPPHAIAAAGGAVVAASSAIALLAARLVLGAIYEGRKDFYVEGGAAYRRRWLHGRGEPLRVDEAARDHHLAALAIPTSYRTAP